MPIRVVLVDPLYPENVGYVARAMGNYGVDDLVLVRGCELSDLSYERATHARPILEDLRRVETLDEALDGCGLVVGTTARTTPDPKMHHRETLWPSELRDKLEGVEGRVAVVFGREDKGLFNEEIGRCDLAVTVPTRGDPSLNLGHACVVVLYALRAEEGDPLEELEGRPLVEGTERRHLHDAFDRLLEVLDYPDHQRFRARTMFRTLVGRATPSKWEYHRLMGVFDQVLDRLEEE